MILTKVYHISKKKCVFFFLLLLTKDFRFQSKINRLTLNVCGWTKLFADRMPENKTTDRRGQNT